MADLLVEFDGARYVWLRDDDDPNSGALAYPEHIDSSGNVRNYVAVSPRFFGYNLAWLRGSMSTIHLVPDDLQLLYDVHEWRNAVGVLQTACAPEWADIISVLREFRLYESEVTAAGGNRSPISKRLDGAFYKRGWVEKKFSTAIMLSAPKSESESR